MLTGVQNVIAFLRSRLRLRLTALVPNALPKAALPAGDLTGRGRLSLFGMKK